MINLNLFSAALTFAVGLFFLFRLRFFFILHPVKIGKKIAPALRDRTMRRNLCLALAGTLGVGNIYGVALGIILGGEGSLFWLFVSSFFAMAIKYSESFIAVKIGVSGSGMMPAIRQSFKKIGKPLAYLYCLFMLLLALFMGAFIQSESLVSSAKN
jgi:AGCS family alanine or glycine:cation symporter